MITSQNDVNAGLAGTDRQRMVLNKSSINGTAGRYISLWRATGTPAQAAIPAAVTICDKTTIGAWSYVAPDTANSKRHYFAGGAINCSNSTMCHEVHDRLVHMGGLNATLTTAQTVGLVVTGVTSNLPARLGVADLSELQWWLEVYTTTGVTGVTATIAVTHTDNSTVNISLAYPVSAAAGNAFLLATPTAGKIIKSIDTVTLSATTGTAGSFGFTVTRRLFSIVGGPANGTQKLSFIDTELATPEDNTCITFMSFSNTANSGALIGYLNLIHK